MVHLLRRLLLLPRPSYTLDLIHRKALRSTSVNNTSGSSTAPPPSRFALSNGHHRVYLLWKGSFYLYQGVLVVRFLLLSGVLFLDRKFSGGSSVRFMSRTYTESYARLDPVLGGLVVVFTFTENYHQNFFFCFLVAALLTGLSLHLDHLLHFRLDLFTTQLFQEAVNLNGVHFWAVNRHLKRSPQFSLTRPLASAREVARWARHLWNTPPDRLQQSCSFYFRRLRKFPHLSRSVRLKVLLVVMAAEKVVVGVMYTTLVVCTGFALAYIYALSEPSSSFSADGFDEEEDFKYSKAVLSFFAGYYRRFPPLSSLVDIALLAYTAFNASRSFLYLLYYLAIALFANVAHQAENGRKLRQLVARCRRTSESGNQRFQPSPSEEVPAAAAAARAEVRRTSQIPVVPVISVVPVVSSTNGLLYAQNLAACLVFYYQERLFFLYACLRLNGLAAADRPSRKGRGGKKSKRKNKNRRRSGGGEGGGGDPVSGLLGASFVGCGALGTLLLAPLFTNWYGVSWSQKFFLFGFFVLQAAYFCSAVALLSSASGWLHRPSISRLLYSAQSALRPRANVVAVVAKLKLMTRFELVHTRRPFTFCMLQRSVGVRREALYQYALLYTAFLFALFKLVNKEKWRFNSANLLAENK